MVCYYLKRKEESVFGVLKLVVLGRAFKYYPNDPLTYKPLSKVSQCLWFIVMM